MTTERIVDAGQRYRVMYPDGLDSMTYEVFGLADTIEDAEELVRAFNCRTRPPFTAAFIQDRHDPGVMGGAPSPEPADPAAPPP